MARGGGSGTSTVIYTDPSNNPGDTYYVHASDGPNTISIKPDLNHSNYQVWAQSMRRALGGKNKFEFVIAPLKFLLNLIRISKHGTSAIC
jgi:hypothetical protein